MWENLWKTLWTCSSLPKSMLVTDSINENGRFRVTAERITEVVGKLKVDGQTDGFVVHSSVTGAPSAGFVTGGDVL
jgi:hypothetical protein